MIKTLEWTDGAKPGEAAGIRFIDQRKLPVEEVYITCTTYEEVADAIRTMLVRGAPAIGVAAAMGVALGAKSLKTTDAAAFRREFEHICDVLAGTRPTAVNLFWAIRRMRDRFSAVATQQVATIQAALIEEAKAIYVEDLAANEAMGKHGATLMPSSGGVLTHCNAGALATAGGYGTALGVIRAAFESGKKINVYADETRPVLQGSRLTAWELTKDGIPTTVISDNMAGVMMAQGKIKAAVVGADRIAANGDVANKIGTYTVAVMAHAHGIPFYVAAPWSTIDLETKTGADIPIEQRDPREVTHVGQTQIAPDGIKVENPSFDVTPARYVAAIITERGIAKAPYEKTLRELSTAVVRS
ncbi:MAG: S-methyl-5-thioribose-1-phosphate isomerase [Candidatus Koribacter versatilis]|uniref:Methylthioribose-1-phosphate isomerase n=1 Tax=Candidatus Korobacter versatilis TaxID=658062 RepID=A0A932EPK0_9BACT|nr:S-methyl-5-thioribose-1-phosphate isomerase [Candidatus Koribacter versatilis]